MGALGAVGSVGLVALLVPAACSIADDPASRDAAPHQTRVTGPSGFSYAVGADGWELEPKALRWTDDHGRTLARLRDAATFGRGYAVGVCGEQLSALAVTGWTRGRTHAHVVRRLVRAVGGRPGRRSAAAPWRATLPGGTPARLTREVVEVVEGGPCRAGEVDLSVVTLLPPGRARHPTWVYVADRVAAAPPDAEVVAIAASLRSN